MSYEKFTTNYYRHIKPQEHGQKLQEMLIMRPQSPFTQARLNANWPNLVIF